MIHHLLISTECCDKAKHHKVVRLSFNFTVDSNGIKFEKNLLKKGCLNSTLRGTMKKRIVQSLTNGANKLLF